MDEKVHAILDTNVLVSGILWDKLLSQAIAMAFDVQFQLVTSNPLLNELQDVLSRTKFTDYLRRKRQTWQEILADIKKVSLIVEPVEIHPVVLDDPDDDVLIATALATPVDCIVTGNRHLLDLGEYQHIPIYTVEQFLRLFDLQS